MPDQTTKATTAVTTWGILATDGVLYTTLALLLAAGKTAFPDPNLWPGAMPKDVVLRSEDGFGSSGGRFYYKLTPPSTFTGGSSTETTRDNQSQLVGNADQAYSVGEGNDCPQNISQVWVRKLAATDIISVSVKY